MLVKICGMRRIEDIEYVNKHRPDYAGFILSAGFRRSIDIDTFKELIRCLDKDIKKVGVFVDQPIEDIIQRYSDYLDVIQLHGSENEAHIRQLRNSYSGEIWKAVKARSCEDIEKAARLDCDKLVIDSFVEGAAGGTGKVADWDIVAKAHFDKDYFLAGGISSENVFMAAQRLSPCGFDLSSSVETNGVKDEKKIKEIIDIIRRF